MTFFLDLSIVIIILGICGILVNKRNILISVIAIEMMFYGLNFYLVTLSVLLDDIMGEIFALFILTLAAGESALALAFITSYFRVYENILIKEL